LTANNNRWWYVVIPILATVIISITAWEFSTGISQAATDTRQDEQIKTLQEQFQKVDKKLDEILRELRTRPQSE